MKITDAELAELAAGITPGPWTKGLRLIIRRVYKDDQGRRVTRFIAEVLGFAGRDDQSEPEANAQAIARVPDILADLIAAREALRRIAGHNFEDTGNWKDDARMFQNIAMEALE